MKQRASFGTRNPAKVKTWLKEVMETSPPDSAIETPKRQRTEDPVS